MMEACTDDGEEMMIPMNFGNYRIVSKIATGGSSVVVKVAKKGISEMFACKVMSRLRLGLNPVINIEQELRVQQQLQHENILKILDIVFHEKYLFVITEYCEHGDLMSFLIERPMAISAVFAGKMVRQLTSALVYIHSRGIAHRDLKPDNILLDSSYTLKLTDFGCCETSLNTPLSGVGTLFYIPPESLLGHCNDGAKADIWALGIITYALVVHTFPWRDGDQDKVAEEIINGKIEIPSYISPGMTKLINMCTNKDPELRPTASEIMSYIATCPEFELPQIKASSTKLSQLTISPMIKSSKAIDPKKFMGKKAGSSFSIPKIASSAAIPMYGKLQSWNSMSRSQLPSLYDK